MIANLLRELFSLCLKALPGWLLLRGLYLLLRRPKRFLPLREIVLALFASFMAALLCMVWDGQWASPAEMLQSALERLKTGDKINWLPGQNILPFLQKLPDVEAVAQLAGNTLLFIPWGFCLPLLWTRFRRPLSMVGMSLALTCVIEGVQLFIGRFVELDDVLLNFLGGMCGAGLWAVMHRLFPQADKWLLDQLISH